jgi:hypothetical protein
MGRDLARDRIHLAEEVVVEVGLVGSLSLRVDDVVVVAGVLTSSSPPSLRDVSRSSRSSEASQPESPDRD